jgi:hypothetical protein
MWRKFIGCCVAVGTIWLTSATSSMPAGGAFTRGCAARDMQIMILIEASAISPQERIDAVHTIMHARIMCYEGYVVDALALYDTIAQRASSGWALSEQSPQ